MYSNRAVVAKSSSDYVIQNELGPNQNRLIKEQVLSLKERLREKEKVKAFTEQEVRSATNKIIALKNELGSEIKAKEMLMNKLEEFKAKMVDLRLKYTEKGKDSVVHLKELHLLDLRLKDVVSRVDSKRSTELRAGTMKKAAENKVLEVEKSLTTLMGEFTIVSHNLETATAEGKELQMEVEAKTAEKLRMEHANKVEIAGLQQVLKEKQMEETEIRAQSSTVEKELQTLTKELEENTQRAEKERGELARKVEVEESKLAPLLKELEIGKRRIQMIKEDIVATEEREKLLHQQLEANATGEGETQAAIQDCRQRSEAVEKHIAEKNEENGRLVKAAVQVKADLEVIETKIANKEAESRKQNVRLRDLTAQIAAMEARTREEEMRFMDSKHALATGLGHLDKILAKKAAAEDLNAQGKAAHSAAVTRLAQLEQALKDVLSEEGTLEKRLQEKMTENEKLEKKIHAQQSQYVVTIHHSKERIEEYEIDIDRRRQQAPKLHRQISVLEIDLELIKDRVSSINEEALEAKAVLEKRITEVAEKDRQMRSRIFEQENAIKHLSVKADEAQANVTAATSKLISIDGAIADMRTDHGARLIGLQAQLESKNKEAEHVERGIPFYAKAQVEWERRVATSLAETTKLNSALATEEIHCQSLKRQYSDLRKLEKEAWIRTESQVQSLKLLEQRLAEKLDERSQLRKRLDGARVEVSFAERRLRDDEVARLRSGTALEAEDTAARELESFIKSKETQFEADAVAVRSCVGELENALKERAQAAERLDHAVDRAKENHAHLISRLETTRAARAEQAKTLGALLEKEKETAKGLEKEAIEKKNAEVRLQAVLRSRSDELDRIEVKIEDAENAKLVLKADIAKTRDDVALLKEKLEKQENFVEKEMLEQIDAMDAQIADLKTLVGAKSQLEQTLIKQVHSKEKDVTELKSRVKKKQKEEVELEAELASTRIQFAAIKGPSNLKDLEHQAIRADKGVADYETVLRNILDPAPKKSPLEMKGVNQSIKQLEGANFQ